MKKFINFLIILMGIACCTGQVLLIREFLTVFYGNELIIGIILANWLILEAIGSFVFGIVCKKINSPRIYYAVTQILVGILLPLSIFACRNAKNILNAAPGEGIGILPTMLASFIIMLPLGIILGGQFPLICKLYQKQSQKTLTQSIGTSYFLEGVGFGIAGIIITFLLIPYFNSVQIALFLGIINIITACLILIKKNKVIWAGFLILISIMLFNPCADYLHSQSLKYQWGKANLIGYENSIYGNIAVTKQSEQYSFYYDGSPFMTIPLPNTVFTQEIVTYALCVKNEIQNVMVIGSGLGGIINNILQFPVKQIHYAELDPLVIDMAKRYPAEITAHELADPRLIIHNTDGRRLLSILDEKFDAVIINLPPPSTLQLNRFYTQEFFALLNQKLNSQGIICLSIPGSLSYLSDEQIDLNKSILETLKTVFTSVEIIPGNYTLFLASNTPILTISPIHITQQLKKLNINQPLFNEYYLTDRLSADRKQWFLSSLKTRAVQINKDLKPVGVFYSLSLWNSLFSPAFQQMFSKTSRWTLPGAIVILLLLTFGIAGIIKIMHKKNSTVPLCPRLLPLIVLSSGFTGLALNLIFLLSLQTFYGYVYLYIGLLISVYMIGLTCGSLIMTRQMEKIKNDISTLLKTDTAFILFTGLSALLLFGMHKVAVHAAFSNYIIFILALMSGAVGFLAGFEFPLANKIYLAKKENPANILYAIDMAGSFTGAIFVSVFLIPILGIIQTIIFITALKISLLSIVTYSLRKDKS